MRPVIEVFTSSTFRQGKGGAGIVIRSAGQTVRVIRRAVRAESRAQAAYRALLHGVWRARGTGARQIRAYSDHEEIVAQITGSAEVPPELTGLYLQTRALFNAYRWSALEYLPRERNTEAAIAAVEALDEEPLAHDVDLDAADPLPLFTSSAPIS